VPIVRAPLRLDRAPGDAVQTAYSRLLAARKIIEEGAARWSAREAEARASAFRAAYPGSGHLRRLDAILARSR
jgi:hypothetical protein